MERKTASACFACLSLAATLAGADNRTITEEQVLTLLEQSPALHSLALEADRARAEVGAAGLWPNPVLFLSRENSAETTDRFLNVSQAVPLSGRLGLERAAAESLSESAASSLRYRRAIVRAEARSVFYQLLESQERLAALVATRDNLQELVRALEAREREGESAGFDVMRARRELAEVEADLSTARVDQSQARLALAALIPPLRGTELLASGRLSPAGDPPSLETLLARAEARGDVEALDRERASAELARRAASRLKVPEIAVAAGSRATDTPAASDTGPVVALNVAIPLFNRGQAAEAIGRAQAALALERRQAALHQALAEIESAYAELLLRRDAERTYARAPSADELIRIAWVSYQEGERGILELLDAYRTALAVRLRHMELAAATRESALALDRAVGEEVTR